MTELVRKWVCYLFGMPVPKEENRYINRFNEVIEGWKQEGVSDEELKEKILKFAREELIWIEKIRKGD